jgi:hypothetical protein
MAVPVNPGTIRTYGMDAWAWVPAIANTSAPTVAEVTAVTGLNISCYILGEQDGASADVERVTLPRLKCETQTYEVVGETKWTHANLVIVVHPQAAALSNGKKGWEAIDDLETGFLVRRFGILPATDFATGQFVNVYPGQMGVKVMRESATDAAGIAVFDVGFSITSAPKQNVALT